MNMHFTAPYATTTGLISPALAILLAAEKAAFEAHDAACKASDSVELGREATEDEELAADTASEEQTDALQAVFRRTPTCSADLIAMVDLFDLREMDIVPSPISRFLANLFSSARAFLDPDSYSGNPDPVDVLWAEWHARVIRADLFTDEMDDDEADKEFAEVAVLERQIRQALPSVMRTGAVALIELYHANAFLDEGPLTPAEVASTLDGKAWLAISALEGIRPQLRGAVRRCADDLLGHPDVPLWEGVLHRRPDGAPHRRPAPLFSEAAE